MKLAHLPTRLEVKAASDDGSIEGLGSVFGNIDSYGDIIEPGAFKKSIASGRPVKMLWQHDANQPVGVWDEVSEDGNGLRVKGRIAVDTTLGRDVMAMLRMKAIDGLSIGYRTIEADFNKETGVRTIKEVELWEVSVVTFPANPMAILTGIKSREDIDEMDLADIEKALREAGFSRDEAKWLMHRHTAIVRQREADDRQAEELSRVAAALAAKIRAS